MANFLAFLLVPVGNQGSQLIGFLRPEDRKFFNLFTTVKGIGPKTALKALTVPVGEIAVANRKRAPGS